jgi:hypothetical protein
MIKYIILVRGQVIFHVLSSLIFRKKEGWTTFPNSWKKQKRFDSSRIAREVETTGETSRGVWWTSATQGSRVMARSALLFLCWSILFLCWSEADIRCSSSLYYFNHVVCKVGSCSLISSLQSRSNYQPYKVLLMYACQGSPLLVSSPVHIIMELSPSLVGLLIPAWRSTACNLYKPVRVNKSRRGGTNEHKKSMPVRLVIPQYQVWA